MFRCAPTLFLLCLLAATGFTQAPRGTLLLDLDGEVGKVTVARVWARTTPWQAPRVNGAASGLLVLKGQDGSLLARVPLDLEHFNLDRGALRGRTLVAGDRVFVPRLDCLAKIPDYGAALATLDIILVAGDREMPIGGIDGAALRGRIVGGFPEAAPTVKTVRNSGPVQNRYDIVILGDGYQASEESRFDADVAGWIKDLFSREPYKRHLSFFNVHTVFRASAQSGANHPDRTPPVVVNNAYGASYNTGGTARCLYIKNASQAKADAALAPDVEGRIVVFVNDARYGGCAGTFAVSYNGSSANAVQSHEFGHSFGKLADEYDYGKSGTYTGSEPSAANITADATGATKWPLWLGTNGVGVFQGAGYYKLGLYRPKSSCLMRGLSSPLCEICIEQILKQSYLTTTPVETPKPAGNANLSSPAPVVFSFTDLTPGGGVITWYLDQKQVQSGGTSYRLIPAALNNGIHQLKVEIKDPTPMVRKDPTGLLRTTHTWQVGIDLNQVTTPLYRHDAPAGTALGTALVGPGDLDGDGWPDLLAATGSGGARAYSGTTGQLLYTVSGGTGAGTALTSVGDLNGDGRPDLCLGHPADGVAGSVRIISGRDGHTLIKKLLGTTGGDRFGHAVCGTGDINGDGTPDLAVGAPGAGGKGRVTLYSGKDWKVIRTLTGDGSGNRFGHALASLGDIDNDKVNDLAVGAPLAGTLGQVTVWSGAKGGRLKNLTDYFTGSRFGSALAGVGDINSDGTPDIAVGAPLGLGYGHVLVFSGRDFTLQQMLTTQKAGSECGRVIAPAGDVDADGRPDILVGSPLEGSKGAWRLYSGRDSTVLEAGYGTTTGAEWGAGLAGLGDINGDGKTDFAAGAPGYGAGAGQITVTTLAKTLQGTSHVIPIAGGGKESFALNAGTAHAGKHYILLGSMAGTTPATVIQGVCLPLVVDPYTSLTLLFAGSSLLPLSVGQLDSQGKAAPGLSIPGGTLHSSLVNQVLHHAAVVIDTTRGGIDLATNAAPLMLL